MCTIVLERVRVRGLWFATHTTVQDDGIWKLKESIQSPILLHPPLHSVGFSIGMERGCQQNDSHPVQDDGIWNLKEGIRSPTDWAEPVAVMGRLASLVVYWDGIVSRPPGAVSRRRDCHSAAPSSSFSGNFNRDGEGMSAK